MPKTCSVWPIHTLIASHCSCTNNYWLSFKIAKSGRGRPPVLFVCRIPGCGFYSNRSAKMMDHCSRTHEVGFSKSNLASYAQHEDSSLLLLAQKISSKVKARLLKDNPSLTDDFCGYLDEDTEGQKKSKSLAVPLNVIEELVFDMSRLSFDISNLPPIIQQIDLVVYVIEGDIVQELNPTLLHNCPNSLDKVHKCHITKEGFTERTRAFDIAAPFVLTVPQFKCSYHGKFNLLKCVTPASYTFPSLVVLPNTIVTQPFLNYVFNLAPGHYFNFNKMLNTIHATWTSNFESRLQSDFTLCRKSAAQCQDDLKAIDQVTKTSATFIESLYFLASKQMKPKFEAQQNQLWRHTGSVLRIDHTYKVVKNLSAYSEEHGRTQIKASLFTVLNEKGQVLVSKIVASDEGVHMKKSLKLLWRTPGRTSTTKYVFTDNSVKDRNIISASWKKVNGSNPSPSVHQDVWHALHRIDQVMNHKHPDYHSAKKSLSECVSTASNPEEISLNLKSWSLKYEVCQKDSVDTVIAKLAEQFAVSRAVRKRKQGARNTEIKEKHCNSLVDYRVKHAINNLANNYAADILPSNSLPEGVKQGTSANETWHKHLSKSFVQDSGSISMELAEAVIQHLQYLYNYSIQHSSDYTPLSGEISLRAAPILRTTATLKFQTLDQILAQGFKPKEMNWLKPREVDIAKCKEYLAQIHTEKHGIGISLLFYLTHYKFENTYTKTYIKKLLTEFEKAK